MIMYNPLADKKEVASFPVQYYNLNAARQFFSFD